MCTCRRRCTDVYFHGENKRKTWQDSEKENEYKLVVEIFVVAIY